MLWPNNPLARLLRREKYLIHSVTVAQLDIPGVPPVVSLGLSAFGLGAITRVGGDVVRRPAVSSASRAEVNLWAAELAWRCGAPVLRRIARRPGPFDPKSEDVLYTDVVSRMFARRAAGRAGVRESLEAGYCLWLWPFEYHRHRYLARMGDEGRAARRAAREADPSLRADGSRSLAYPWAGRDDGSILTGMCIPADRVLLEATTGLTPEAVGPGPPARPRVGQSIPDEVLERAAAGDPDLAALADRIRRDPGYAQAGEMLFAARVLYPDGGRVYLSPLTHAEVIRMDDCYIGDRYGEPWPD